MRHEQAQKARPRGRLEGPYVQLIRKATGAPDQDLARIEQIMRDEIFHSTLDWQSRGELAAAARQAQRRLNEDREMYDLDLACRLAMREVMRAQSAVAKEDSLQNRAALQAAESKYGSAKDALFAFFDREDVAEKSLRHAELSSV